MCTYICIYNRNNNSTHINDNDNTTANNNNDNDNNINVHLRCSLGKQSVSHACLSWTPSTLTQTARKETDSM